MRRLLVVLLIFCLVLAVAILLTIMWSEAVVPLTQRGRDIISFILMLLQLLGIAIAIAIALLVIVQYIQDLRPRHFVFGGFSNVSKLLEAEKMPLDLDMLAREKLVYQFEILNHRLHPTDDTSTDVDALFDAERCSPKNPAGSNIRGYLLSDQIKKEIVDDLTKDLTKITADLNMPKYTDLVNLVGEIAPAEITPFMRLVDAVIPPHIIKAVGHLQWWKATPDCAGITFDFVDLGEQRSITVRTIRWHPSDENSSDKSTISELACNELILSGKGNGESVHREQEEPDENQIIQLATDRYLELLDPSMRWLALVFWEQRTSLHVPFRYRVNRDKNYKEERLAYLQYILGALYYTSANEFRAYDQFFTQLAIEHFGRAIKIKSDWYLPYLQLATIYSFKMLELRSSKSQNEVQQKLLQKVLHLCGQALDNVGQQNKKTIDMAQRRITVIKLLAEVASGTNENLDKAAPEFEGLEKWQDPADIDPKQQPDCSAYLYQLATLYTIAYNEYIPHVRDKALRYLAYSLARSSELRDKVNVDPNFQKFMEEGDLVVLKEELEKKIREKPDLEELAEEPFRDEIDKILGRLEELKLRKIKSSN